MFSEVRRKKPLQNSEKFRFFSIFTKNCTLNATTANFIKWLQFLHTLSNSLRSNFSENFKLSEQYLPKLEGKKCPKISNKTPQKCFWQHFHTLEILMNSPVVKLWQRLQFPKTSDSIQVDDDLLAFVSSTNLVSELKNTTPNFNHGTS